MRKPRKAPKNPENPRKPGNPWLTGFQWYMAKIAEWMMPYT
jgi:hypothetical protein